MNRRFKKILYGLIFLLVLISGVVFFLENNQVVNFGYLLGEVELKLSYLILIIFVCGTLLGIIAMFPAVFILKYENSKLKAKIRERDEEVNNLRLISVRDPV